MRPVGDRQHGDLEIIQIGEMLKGGRPLSDIVPDMVVEDTAHLLQVCHWRVVPTGGKR